MSAALTQVEGPEGIKCDLGVDYFLLVNGNGIKIWASYWKGTICTLGHWYLVKIWTGKRGI